MRVIKLVNKSFYNEVKGTPLLRLRDVPHLQGSSCARAARPGSAWVPRGGWALAARRAAAGPQSKPRRRCGSSNTNSSGYQSLLNDKFNSYGRMPR